MNSRSSAGPRLIRLAKRQLRKIAAANMCDYMKSTPEGDPYLDFSTLTPAQTAALKFKLHDKLV